MATTMQSVGPRLARVLDLITFNRTYVIQSDLILSAMRTGALRDPATIQSAHNRASALTVVAK